MDTGRALRAPTLEKKVILMGIPTGRKGVSLQLQTPVLTRIPNLQSENMHVDQDPGDVLDQYQVRLETKFLTLAERFSCENGC